MENLAWRCPLCNKVVYGSHNCEYKFTATQKIDAQQCAFGDQGLNDFSFFNEEDALMYKNKIDSALSKAVKAIYFNDSADYEHYLWLIIEILGGEEAGNLLEDNAEEAYNKYCKNK